ncbi:MAG TPA: response regulator [Bryobacteraceae bacterium]|nr:response regulator [Bryobacteraceae bacterium]
MPDSPRPRVLVVDDESRLTEALCRILETAGYRTTGRTSPVVALDELKPGEFDLLISDVTMPEMSGIDMLEAALRIDGDLAAVMMTGNGSIDTAVAAMRAGAVDYILKPFRIEVVLPVLTRALELRRLRVQNAELNERLRERAEELARLNAALEQRIEARTADLRRSLAEKTTLLQEVHHRVRNNLQVIGSLLSLHAASAAGAEPASALRAASHRVWAMSVVQQQFDSAADSPGVDFSACIVTLWNGLSLRHETDPADIRAEIAAEPIRLPIEQANSCGLILNELISNALRHAFPDGRGGTIRIRFGKTADTRAEFSFSDDGIGLPPDLRARKAQRLGLQLVDVLAAQLRATLRINPGRGASFTLAWDLEKSS